MPLHHTAIPGFTQVAPSLWEEQPSHFIHNVSSEEPPSLIILLPWTGAHGRHVLKYVEGYHTLFPASQILCITTSTKDICLRSSERKQRRLQPAVEIILTHTQYYAGRANILVHAFSEGGSNKAVELAEAYHKTTGTILPCAALCLDSTPGHPRYLRLCNAIKKSLPPIPILNCAGFLIGSVLLGGIWVVYKGFKGTGNNVISRTRGRLQDEKYWNASAPRCYLYSKGDKLIAWKDIREHVVEAAGTGAPIMDVCFEKSAHCKHAAQYPDRYWESVSWTWKRTCINREKWDLELDGQSGSEETLVFFEKNVAVLGVQELLSD